MFFLKKILGYLFLIFIVNIRGMEQKTSIDDFALNKPWAYYYPVDETNNTILANMEPNSKGVLLSDNTLCIYLKNYNQDKKRYYEEKGIVVINHFLDKSITSKNLLAFYAAKTTSINQLEYMYFALYSSGDNIALSLNKTYLSEGASTPCIKFAEKIFDCDSTQPPIKLKAIENNNIKSSIYPLNDAKNISDFCFLAFIYTREQKNTIENNCDTCHIGVFSKQRFLRHLIINQEFIITKLFEEGFNRHEGIKGIFKKLYGNQSTNNSIQYPDDYISKDNTSCNIIIDDTKITKNTDTSTNIYIYIYVRIFLSSIINEKTKDLFPIYTLLHYKIPLERMTNNYNFKMSTCECKTSFLQIKENNTGFFRGPIYFEKTPNDISSNEILPIFFNQILKNNNPVNNDIKYYVTDLKDYFNQNNTEKNMREIQIMGKSQKSIISQNITIDYYKNSEQLPIEVKQKFEALKNYINTLKESSFQKELISIINLMEIMFTDLNRTLHFLEGYHNSFQAQKNEREEEIQRGVKTLDQTIQNANIKFSTQTTQCEQQIKAFEQQLQRIKTSLNESEKEAQNQFVNKFNSTIQQLTTDFLNILAKHEKDYTTKIDSLEKTLQDKLDNIKKIYELPLQEIKAAGETNNNLLEVAINSNQNLTNQLKNSLAKANTIITNIEKALKDLERFQDALTSQTKETLKKQYDEWIVFQEQNNKQLKNITTRPINSEQVIESLKKQIEDLKNELTSLKTAKPSSEGFNWRLNFVTTVCCIYCITQILNIIKHIQQGNGNVWSFILPVQFAW